MDSPGATQKNIKNKNKKISYQNARCGMKMERQGRDKLERVLQTGERECMRNSLAAVAEDLLTWTQLEVLSALVCKNLCYVYTLR